MKISMIDDYMVQTPHSKSYVNHISASFLAGSGTTLVAAEELGRQWIGADIGDEAISTITERFKNGSKPMGDYVKKNKKAPAAMDWFGEEKTISIQETVNKPSVTYDLFTVKEVEENS